MLRPAEITIDILSTIELFGSEFLFHFLFLNKRVSGAIFPFFSSPPSPFGFLPSGCLYPRLEERVVSGDVENQPCTRQESKLFRRQQNAPWPGYFGPGTPSP